MRPSSRLLRARGKFARASEASFYQSSQSLPCLGLSFLFQKKQALPSLILVVELRRVNEIQPAGPEGKEAGRGGVRLDAGWT